VEVYGQQGAAFAWLCRRWLAVHRVLRALFKHWCADGH